MRQSISSVAPTNCAALTRSRFSRSSRHADWLKGSRRSMSSAFRQTSLPSASRLTQRNILKTSIHAIARRITTEKPPANSLYLCDANRTMDPFNHVGHSLPGELIRGRRSPRLLFRGRFDAPVAIQLTSKHSSNCNVVFRMKIFIYEIFLNETFFHNIRYISSLSLHFHRAVIPSDN